MRQSVRVLGWTVNIVTFLIFIFLMMPIYSLVQTMAMGQGIKAGEPSLENLGGKIVLSTPFTVNNTGYFEISELRITTVLKDPKGTDITDATTIFEKIPSGLPDSKRHNLSLSINDIVNKNLTYLFFNDAKFLMDTIVELRYANILRFKVLIPNASMPWGAPFSNFRLGEPSIPKPIPGEPNVFSTGFPVSFENHSPFPIRGTISVNVYNQGWVFLGSGNKPFNVESNSFYSDQVWVEISEESLRNYTGKGYLEIRFVTDTSSFKLPVVTYG